MVLNTLYLVCFALSFIHITDAKCSEYLVKYWERRYRKNYFGDLEPWNRCKAERGTCMREQDNCNSGDWVRYQTKCDNKCECCIRKERISDGLDWVLVENRLTWEDAREDCRKEKNGDLVVPENVADLIKFIKRKDLGSADIWVGINDYFNSRFEGIYGNEVIDGWHEGHPRRQTYYRGNCVVVEDVSSRKDEVGMKVEPCWAKNYYVCDVNRNNRRRLDVFLNEEKSRWRDSDEESDEDEDEEDDSEATFGEHIKIFADRKTWEDAREDCREKGGDLLIPRSVDDLVHFMEKLGVEERDVWLGFSDHHHNEDYKGIHGNQINDATLWQPGQPQPQEQGDDCVVIENDNVKGVGLKVNPCSRKQLYACDLSEDYRDSHTIGH